MIILVTIDTIDELHQGSSNQVEKVAEICNMQSFDTKQSGTVAIKEAAVNLSLEPQEVKLLWASTVTA